MRLALLLCVAACTRGNPAKSIASAGGVTLTIHSATSYSFLANRSPSEGDLWVVVGMTLADQAQSAMPLVAQNFSLASGGLQRAADPQVTPLMMGGCELGASLIPGASVTCDLAFGAKSGGTVDSLSYTLPSGTVVTAAISGVQCGDCAEMPPTTPTTPSTPPTPSMPPTPSTPPTPSMPPLPSADAACASSSDTNACVTCCTDHHSSGYAFYNTILQQCLCVSPGTCASLCGASFCKDTSQEDTLCSACLQANAAAGDACDVTPQCNTDADCAALLVCVNHCP